MNINATITHFMISFDCSASYEVVKFEGLEQLGSFSQPSFAQQMKLLYEK